MRTNELTGEQLALWVARAANIKLMADMPPRLEGCFDRDACDYEAWAPHEDWSQGGPLLDRLMASGEWHIEPWNDTGLGIAPGCTVMISNYMLGGPSYDAHDVPVKEGNTAPRMDFVTPALLQAVCQAIVASVYGPNVPDGAP